MKRDATQQFRDEAEATLEESGWCGVIIGVAFGVLAAVVLRVLPSRLRMNLVSRLEAWLDY